MGGAVTTPEMTALYLCPLFQRFQAYELQVTLASLDHRPETALQFHHCLNLSVSS